MPIHSMLEQEKASVLAWRIPTDKGAWRATVYNVTEPDTTEQLKHIHSMSLKHLFYFCCCCIGMAFQILVH